MNQAKDRNNQLNIIKEQFAHYKDGKTKEEFKVQISSRIKFVYVIISQGNIGKDRMENFIREIKLLENVDIFVISKDEHLNSYNDISETQINETDFNELDELINKKLNE